MHFAFVLGLGCFPMLLENEFIPIVHMTGVLPGAGACLPEVSEFWQMLRRLSLGALSGTSVQGGRLEGKSSVCVWSPRLHTGLFLPGLAFSPVGRFSPETHSSFPPGHCLLLGGGGVHSALWAFWSDWFPCTFPRSCVFRKSRKIITGSSWSPRCE